MCELVQSGAMCELVQSSTERFMTVSHSDMRRYQTQKSYTFWHLPICFGSNLSSSGIFKYEQYVTSYSNIFSRMSKVTIATCTGCTQKNRVVSISTHVGCYPNWTPIMTITFHNWTVPPSSFSQECTSASQSFSSTALDRTCSKRRQSPSPLTTPFAGPNTMRFLSLGVR